MSFLLVLLCSYSSSSLKVFVLSIPSDHKNLAEVQWPRWSGRSHMDPHGVSRDHLPPGECHKEFQHFSRTLWSKSPNRFGVQAPCMAHIALSQDGTACDWCANLHASVAKRTVSTCNCLRIDTSGEAVGH